MANKTINYKFRNKSFAGYGLNKFKNFMKAPQCECGCGGTCSLVINNNEDLFGFMNEMLLDNGCNCSAIFAHSYDDKLYAAILCVDDDDYEEYEDNENDDIDKVDFDDEDADNVDENKSPVKIFGTSDEYLEFFQEWDAELTLHCYALMIETKKGQWEIIED